MTSNHDDDELEGSFFQGAMWGRENTLRKIYILLGRKLQSGGMLANGMSPESYAEINVYIQKLAKDYSHSIKNLPTNIFTVSLEDIEKVECKFWQEVIQQCGSGADYNYSSEKSIDLNVSNFIPCRFPQGIKVSGSKLNLSKIEYVNHESKNGVLQNEETIKPTSGNNFFYDLGFNTLGPVFSCFALWLVQQDANKVFWPLMREGEFLSKVVKAFGGKVGQKLYISRLTSQQAAMANPNDSECIVNFLIRSRTCPISIGKALDLLGIYDKSAVILPLDQVVIEENINEILHLLNKPTIKEQRIEYSQKVLKNLLVHLDNSGANQNEDLHFIDMGYAGNILSNLSVAFKFSNRRQQCHGNFLMSSVGAVWAQQKGCEIKGCFSQNGVPREFSTLYFRTPELLELCCSAEIGTTVGYKDDGSPICELAPLPTWQYKEIKQIQDGVLSFVGKWIERNNYKADGDFRPSVKSLRQEGQERLTRLLDTPTSEEAMRLGKWYYDDSPSSNYRTLGGLLDGSFDPKKSDRFQLIWPQAYTVNQRNV